jgi:hypothetical protein
MTDDRVTAKQAQLASCKAAAERAYDLMYELRGPALDMQIAIAKDALRDAHRISIELGLAEEAEAVMERLMHVKAVARQMR